MVTNIKSIGASKSCRLINKDIRAGWYVYAVDFAGNKCRIMETATTRRGNERYLIGKSLATGAWEEVFAVEIIR